MPQTRSSSDLLIYVVAKKATPPFTVRCRDKSIIDNDVTAYQGPFRTIKRLPEWPRDPHLLVRGLWD